MPLDDEQAACVLSYVRNAWGNSGSTVTAAQVAQVRAKISITGAGLVTAHESSAR
jgi:mono/diheme cytochrome c family protein